MKKVILLAALIPLVMLIPSHAGASPVGGPDSIVFEVTEWILGIGAKNYEFVADVEPYEYRVTLSNLSTAPHFGFKFLFLSITTATGIIDSIDHPGSFTFSAMPGETYSANVFGDGGGDFSSGLFGVEVAAIPIPPSLLLLGSGLLSLIIVRRRKG